MKILGLIASLSITVLVLLTGCNQAATVAPIGETAQVSAVGTQALPTRTVTVIPTALTIIPSMTPPFVFAPDEGEPVYPLAGLRILSPGEGSRLVSPIRSELSIVLGVDDTVDIELINASGALLVKKLLRYPGIATGQRIQIRPEIDFEISSDEENGRLVVKTYDEFNRLVTLVSCDLILLSTGEPESKAASIPYESFLLTEPLAGTIIQGGVVTVSGYIRPVSQSAIVFELVDEKGLEISNRVLTLTGDPGGAPIIFTTTLPYQVGQETMVRLIVRQTKGSIPGPAVASSLMLRIK